MNIRLFDLLNKLKSDYSEELLKETLQCFRDEHYVSDYYTDPDKTRELFNNQHISFYRELASDFIEDLNSFPEMYFLVWEPTIHFLDNNTKFDFYRMGIELDNNSDATDYLNGLIELEENDNPEIAQYHFNRIDDYVAGYFVGICYYILDNFENGIKQNLIFLTNLQETIKNISTKQMDLSQDPGFLITLWNVNNDLGYLFNRVENYSNAKYHYEKGLEIFNLEETFKIASVKYEHQEVDGFTIFINNYLLSLEKSGNYSKAIEILNFALEKVPNDIYYKTKKESFEAKRVNTDFADEIIKQIFKTRQPFNIGRFEQTKLIAKEKALEDLIVEQIKYGFHVFGRPLEIYQDDFIFGRQYYISTVNGFLDLLLIDKSDNTLYVVELKRNEAGVEVVDQIEKYINGLSEELNRKIKGIICIHKADKQLEELVKTKPEIELYTYQFEFKKYE